jgi:hypothetical protein
MSISIRVASFSMITTADVGPVASQLAQQNVGWVDTAFVDRLFRASSTGHQYTQLTTFPPSFGASIERAAGQLEIHTVERKVEPSGRYYQLSRFWVVEPSDAARLHYNFAVLREQWAKHLGTDAVPNLVTVPVELEPEHRRLERLVSGNPALVWRNLWLVLVDAACRRNLPIAVQDVSLSLEELLNLCEAVILSLPEAWRNRFGFATSICDASASSARVKFMIMPNGLDNHCVVRPSDKIPHLKEPANDFARLLSDSVKGNWLGELASYLPQVGVAPDGDTTTLAREMYDRVWPHYGPDAIWGAILNPHETAQISRRLRSVTGEQVDYGFLFPSAFWEKAGQVSDWEAILPNFQELRNSLNETDKTYLDSAVFKMGSERLQGMNTPESEAQAVERLLVSYPWSEAHAVALVTNSIIMMQSGPDTTRLVNLIEKAVDRYPTIASALLGQPGLTEYGKAMIVSMAWQTLFPSRHGSDYYSVKTTDRSWIVRAWTAATIHSVGQSPRTEIPHAWLYTVRARSSKSAGWVGVRPHRPGDPLAQRMNELSLQDVKSVLSQVAQALDCFHDQQAFHGNVRAETVVLQGREAFLVDESLDSFSPSNLGSRQIGDREEFLRMVFAALEKKQITLQAAARRKLEEQARSLRNGAILQEVWEMLDRETVREHMRTLLRETEFQQGIRAALTNDIASLKSQMETMRQQYQSMQADLRRLGATHQRDDDLATLAQDLRGQTARLNSLQRQLNDLQRQVTGTSGWSRGAPTLADRGVPAGRVLFALLAMCLFGTVLGFWFLPGLTGRLLESPPFPTETLPERFETVPSANMTLPAATRGVISPSTDTRPTGTAVPSILPPGRAIPPIQSTVPLVSPTPTRGIPLPTATPTTQPI